MAFSCPKNCWVILVSLSLLLVINTHARDNDVVYKICSMTRNPTFCFQHLAKLGNASLPELGKAALVPAQLLARLAADQAHELLIEGKFPALDNIFKSCVGSYAQTNIDLSALLGALNAGKFQSLPAAASRAFAEAGVCDGQFHPPSAEPAQLKKATQDLLDGVSVVSAVSQLLARG